MFMCLPPTSRLCKVRPRALVQVSFDSASPNRPACSPDGLFPPPAPEPPGPWWRAHFGDAVTDGPRLPMLPGPGEAGTWVGFLRPLCHPDYQLIVSPPKVILTHNFLVCRQNSQPGDDCRHGFSSMLRWITQSTAHLQPTWCDLRLWGWQLCLDQLWLQYPAVAHK
jgi:hypothetical protein